MPSNPRAVVDFEGIDAVLATYNGDGATIVYDATQAGGHAAVGRAVSLSAGSTVQLTADADAVSGRLVKVEPDNRCTVQVGGYMKLPGGLAATLTLGSAIVGATGAAAARGYIRAVNSAVAAELAKARGRIVDATDATNVVVLLD
jgi:hypothetical protein